MQTPQIFKYNDLEQSYRKAKSKFNFTDESSMVKSAGYKVNLLEGSIENIKITTSNDSSILKKIMS